MNYKLPKPAQISQKPQILFHKKSPPQDFIRRTLATGNLGLESLQLGIVWCQLMDHMVLVPLCYLWVEQPFGRPRTPANAPYSRLNIAASMEYKQTYGINCTNSGP